ncbi:sulfite exporter TauE/SafE family protein [Sphingomonas jaspsi]|uniref:sulfite exporter TauE/SafE family protein n=1 Tax=Sphingomonas jaspsi TaxID=392409 RepID=UPI0004ADC3BA|nr:sulfite exporter TauE/SafE family protein [Sphingomonas jaspsi]
MMNADTLAEILPYIGVGFIAQAIDGALGMAFGVITNTLLVGVLGVAPAQASARVHIVETFTTAISGISHALHRNVDLKLFLRLLIPGVIGGAAGAYLLSNIDGSVVKPFVLGYLTLVGLWLLYRGLFYPPKMKPAKVVEPLGLAGGFLDAVGGGGWGPVVTSNLLVQGAEPRKVIGTVNSVEFFLTLTISITFISQLGIADFALATIGLLIGGVIAAPFGAIMAKRLQPKTILTAVGVVLTLTSVYSLCKALGWV